jgi:hypothetical protein
MLVNLGSGLVLVLVETESWTLANVFLVSYYGTLVSISASVILTKTILNPSPFKFYGCSIIYELRCSCIDSFGDSSYTTTCTCVQKQFPFYEENKKKKETEICTKKCLFGWSKILL